MTTEWTVQQLLQATGGRLAGGQSSTNVRGISIDSRSLSPGEAFVAIKGECFDGHAFIDEAARRGASCLVVSRKTYPTNGAGSLPRIIVDDTSRALADLARFHRRRSNIQVVAVTGSCGKTTTKDLIAHLLGGEPSILSSAGTQNNHIGVPLTLLRISSRHRIAVVELGSNHPGEIALLASVVEPDIAVVTNIGPSHMEFFGSFMDVLQEKLSLLKLLPPDGMVALPGDQLDVCLEAPRLLHPAVRRVNFGSSDRCDIQAIDVQRATNSRGMVFRLRDLIEEWKVPLLGYHNVENVLAALACIWAVGLPLSKARKRLTSFVSAPMRSQLVRRNGITILNDCYNANPLSFARGLETLRDLEVHRRIAVIGDMLELGDFAPSAHAAIGRMAAGMGIDMIIAVGAFADYVAKGVLERRAAGLRIYASVDALIRDLAGIVHSGDGLLVKGSRKLQLERVTESLLQGPALPQGATLG